MKKIYVPIIITVLSLVGFGCHNGCGGSGSGGSTTTTATTSTGHPSGNPTTAMSPPQLIGGNAGNLGLTLSTPVAPATQGNGVYVLVYFFGPSTDVQNVTVTDVSSPATTPPVPNLPVTFSNPTSTGGGGPWQVPLNKFTPLVIPGAMATQITLSISASVNGKPYTAVSSGPVASAIVPPPPAPPPPLAQNMTGYDVTTYSNGTDTAVIMILDAAIAQ